jgi:type II secretory pathway component PulF
VFAASVGVTIFLMTVVVPMLLDNLVEAGRRLPWPTRVLKGLSDLLLHYGGWLAVAAALGLLAVGSAANTEAGRLLWHRLVLRVPIIGVMVQKQTLSRMAMVVSTLTRSGIVLLRAMEIAARSCGNLVIRSALEQSRQEVQAGREIGHALERTGAFPPLVIQVFAVGQQTGHLDEMLERLAADYDRQVAVSSTRLASALEPILILVLAVLVGFIMFATVLPILEAGNVL